MGKGIRKLNRGGVLKSKKIKHFFCENQIDFKETRIVKLNVLLALKSKMKQLLEN